MLARVKQDYLSGSVTAFSGREYIRSEWREVPAGFEKQAADHPLLEVQSSLDEVRAESPRMPGLGNPEPQATTEESKGESVPATEEAAVTTETEGSQAPEPPAKTPPIEEPEPKSSRRRKRAAEE